MGNSKAASHNSRARTAVLRPDSSPSSPVLSIRYPGTTIWTELGARRELIWSGQWECEVRRDGKLLSPVSDWEETCWVSDEDADFLELQLELTGGLRIQRQMIMVRRDRILLLADALLGRKPAALEYRGCLPLRSDVAVVDAPDTSEVFLDGRRRAAAVLPLALPEWRCDSRAGALVRTDAGLELRQAGRAASMYCPLLFDFDPRRMNRPLTWRQLTVAESLVVQPADVAVGYRVQLGRDQWLIYRSLAAPANRTLLGHNLSTETLLARFNRTGEVESLIEVE